MKLNRLKGPYRPRETYRIQTLKAPRGIKPNGLKSFPLAPSKLNQRVRDLQLFSTRRT